MALPQPSPNARALVTGASQGIGMAMARDLADMGHNLILVARRKDVLEAFATELQEKYGIVAEVYACDLAEHDARRALIEHMNTREINILINSAGIASFGPFMKQSWDYELTQFHLNGTACFELTRAALDQMLPRREGAICNVGSLAGDMVIPNNATYTFTKSGLNKFTEALHYELRGTGVTCTLLAPGPVREAEVPENEKTIVDRVVPDAVWTTYESCSRETLAAMAAGKRRVVPGPLAKIMEVVTNIGPTRLVAPIIGGFYKKMGQ